MRSAQSSVGIERKPEEISRTSNLRTRQRITQMQQQGTHPTFLHAVRYFEIMSLLPLDAESTRSMKPPVLT